MLEVDEQNDSTSWPAPHTPQGLQTVSLKTTGLVVKLLKQELKTYEPTLQLAQLRHFTSRVLVPACIITLCELQIVHDEQTVSDVPRQFVEA